MDPSITEPIRSERPANGGDAESVYTNDTPTLGGLSYDDVEVVVDEVLGSNWVSPRRPRRFAMDDIIGVDDKDVAMLQASSLRRAFLPHIKRVVETERTSAAANASFVARKFKQRPGVVYSVR